MKLLGIDPGNTTGYSLIQFSPGDEESLKLLAYGQLLFEDVPSWLQGLEDIDVAIMEEFKLLPGRAVGQSRSVNREMRTSQVEGMIRLWCAQKNVKLVMQSPSIKMFAQKQSGLKPTGAHNKNSHWIDAYNHVYYYMIQNEWVGIRTS